MFSQPPTSSFNSYRASQPPLPQSDAFQTATTVPESFQAYTNCGELSTFQSNGGPLSTNIVQPNTVLSGPFHSNSFLPESSHSIPVESMPSQSMVPMWQAGKRLIVPLEEGKMLSEIIDPDSLYEEPQDFDQDAWFTRDTDGTFKRTYKTMALTCEVPKGPLLFQLTVVQRAFPHLKAIDGWPRDMKSIIPEQVSSVKVQSGKLKGTKTYEKQFSEQKVVHATVQPHGTIFWTTERDPSVNQSVRKNVGGVAFSFDEAVYGPYDVQEDVYITSLETVTTVTVPDLRSRDEQRRRDRNWKNKRRQERRRKEERDSLQRDAKGEQSLGGSMAWGDAPDAESSHPSPGPPNVGPSDTGFSYYS